MPIAAPCASSATARPGAAFPRSAWAAKGFAAHAAPGKTLRLSTPLQKPPGFPPGSLSLCTQPARSPGNSPRRSSAPKPQLQQLARRRTRPIPAVAPCARSAAPGSSPFQGCGVTCCHAPKNFLHEPPSQLAQHSVTLSSDGGLTGFRPSIPSPAAAPWGCCFRQLSRSHDRHNPTALRRFGVESVL